MIEAVEVSKTVMLEGAPLTILQPTSLRVAAGGSLAVVGPSGSGKSTLLALLAGLDEPSSGRVVLNGVALDSLDEDGRAVLRRDSVGFVFQNFQLLPALTALQNVSLPLELRGDVSARARAGELLARVGLGERLSHRPAQLSGGEQQRVALARAFANTPAVLFADEPTGSLDAAHGAQVLDLLFALNEDHGTTLVLVTHDERVAGRAGRVVELVDGRVVAEPSPG